MQAIEVKETVDRNGNHYWFASCNAGRLRILKCDLQQEAIKRSIPITQENLATMVAEKLKYKLEWNAPTYGRMVMGTLKNGNYVFVFTGKEQS